jgi:hypothetical protein
MPTSERFAIYFAPERGSPLHARADAWLAQPELARCTVSARRYGFHATLKAPMELSRGRPDLEAALTAFAATHSRIILENLEPRLIDGFLALTTEPQEQALTDFAAEVVVAFEPFRAPADTAERERRVRSPLTPRQIELLDLYGYPYVLEEFRFHMTLTDRLPAGVQTEMLSSARSWFAAVLSDPVALDRLVLFHEPAPGADFVRLDDYPLRGVR